MEFNIKVELDWIEEGGSIDNSIKKQIVNTIVNDIKDKVIPEITKKVIAQMDKQVSKLVTTTYNKILDQKIEITNSWGEVRESYKGVKEMIKKRFDIWLSDKVDEYGKESSYGKYRRMDYFIDCQLKEFSRKFTTETIRIMEEKLRSTLTEDMKQLLGGRILEVINVKDLLNQAKALNQ